MFDALFLSEQLPLVTLKKSFELLKNDYISQTT